MWWGRGWMWVNGFKAHRCAPTSSVGISVSSEAESPAKLLDTGYRQISSALDDEAVNESDAEERKCDKNERSPRPKRLFHVSSY